MLGFPSLPHLSNHLKKEPTLYKEKERKKTYSGTWTNISIRHFTKQIILIETFHISIATIFFEQQLRAYKSWLVVSSLTGARVICFPPPTLCHSSFICGSSCDRWVDLGSPVSARNKDKSHYITNNIKSRVQSFDGVKYERGFSNCPL